MKIEQEETFKPMTITLETKEEYDSFFHIIDEAVNVNTSDVVYMNGKKDYEVARILSDYASNNC